MRAFFQIARRKFVWASCLDSQSADGFLDFNNRDRFNKGFLAGKWLELEVVSGVGVLEKLRDIISHFNSFNYFTVYYL